MGKKKAYLVDGNPVVVEDKDISTFLKEVPDAQEAKAFLVGNDSIAVALKDLPSFMKEVPNAKPLFEDGEPKQSDPYAPKPVTFGTTTSVSPIIPEKPKQRDFTQLKALQVQNEKWTNEKKVMAAHIDNMKESLAYTNPNQQSMFGETTGNNKREVASYVESLDQMTTSVKENNDKQIAILTKVFDKDIKPNYKQFVGRAGYGGIEVPNAGMVQEYTDNLMKEMGVDNADDNKRDFIKNAANQYISSLNTYEKITPEAEKIFEKNTGKSMKTAMDEEQKKLYAPIIEIDKQYEAQSKMLPKIVDAQYQDEMAQIGKDAEHLNQQIKNESAQVDQHFAEMGKQLQAASVNMNQQQYDAALNILNQQYKEAQAEKFDNYTMAFGAVVAQEAKINNQRKTDYAKQNQLNYNAYLTKRNAEMAKLSKDKGYSKEFQQQYEKAFNEAYAQHNKNVVNQLNKNQDDDSVPNVIAISAMKSMSSSLNNLAKSIGLRGLSDGLEKVESGIQMSPKQMGDALEDPNTFKNSTGLLDDIKINLKVTASDLFSKTGAATAGQIAGSGAVGMAMAAGSAYMGNALGVSEGLTMAVGGLVSWAQETHDIKKGIYKQVYATTNDVQLAEQAADIGFESQLYIMGLNMVQMAKFMPDAELLTNMVKNPILRRGAIIGAEQLSNTFEEFYQNAFENSVTDPLRAYQQKTFTDAGDYFTAKLFKQTALQTLPMMGQSAVITFASGAGKGLSGIQKYRADKLQQMRADALLSSQIAKMGDNFGAQQLTQFYDVQGGAATITSITQLQAKGKITAEKATELVGALLNHDRHNIEAKKLSLQGSNLYAYTGLRQKQDEVERDLLSAATEEEKATLNAKKGFIQGLITELTTKGTADIVLFRYKNGVQLTMTQAEATKVLMEEGAAQHIQDAGIEVIAMGKTEKPIQDIVSQIVANLSEKAAATTSDTQTETTSDNNTTQPETQPQTAEERAAAVLARVKRAPQTEKQKLEEELKTATDQEVRTNIGEQITLHETKAQHEQKLKEIEGNIANLSENGKVLENLAKINALAAEKTKTEESISDIDKQLKTKQNERETKAQKGRKKDVLNKGWHDLEEADRITVGGVGAKVDGVNKNLNGSVFSINYTLDDGTKGEARISGQDIVDENGKAVLLKMDNVIQSETDIKKRISDIESLLSSDNASMQETGSGNLIKEAREELQKELADLKSKQTKQPTSDNKKPTFENVPILTRTSEEVELAKNEVWNNLSKLEVGSVIENSDGEIKVIVEKSTDKKGNQLIGIVTYIRQEDGSLRQMTNQIWASKRSDGKIKLEYNPHETGTNSKGERVTVTDQITDKKIDLSKENIFTTDEDGNIVQINKAPEATSDNEKPLSKPETKIEKKTETTSGDNVIQSESNPALRDVESTAKALSSDTLSEETVDAIEDLYLKESGTYRGFFTRMGDLLFTKSKGVDVKNMTQQSLKEKGIDPIAFNKERNEFLRNNEKLILSEYYHKAKREKSDAELVKAVESLLSKEQTQKTTSDKKNETTTDKGRPTKGDRGVQDEASGVGDGVPTKKEEAAAKGEAEQKNEQTDSTSKLEYIQEDQIPESVMVDVLDAKGNNVKVMDDILGRDGKKIGQELVNKQATLTKKDVIKKQREISNKENRLINLIDCITKKKK